MRKNRWSAVRYGEMALLLSLFLILAPLTAQAQDAENTLAAAAAMALASERLDAPMGSYSFNQYGYDIEVDHGEESAYITYNSGDPEGCRAALAVGIYGLVDNQSSGRWTFDVDCTGQHIDAIANLDAYPPEYAVSHYQNGDLIFRNSWTGR